MLGLFLISLVSPLSPGFAAEPKEWTWLAYINADNDLDVNAPKDLDEMSKIGSNNWLNIVTFVDRVEAGATLNYIEQGNIKELKSLGQVDSGDYKFFIDQVKDMMTQFPAKHYVLVVWDHGSGWKSQQKTGIKGISHDWSTGSSISTEQLGVAMAEIKKSLGRNIDILAMDACFMQMMEVAYVVKDSCDFIAGSEAGIPLYGFPYRQILKALKADISARNFVPKLVAEFANSYHGGSQGREATTISALDCSKLNDLKDALDGFAKASMAGSYASQFENARSKVKTFDEPCNNIDLWHLLTLLRENIQDEAFQTAAVKLDGALKAAIIANAITNLPNYTQINANGLAIYFPKQSHWLSGDYLLTPFAENSLWDEMLQDYYKKLTVTSVMADIEKGDVTGLKNYVKNIATFDPEIGQYLIEKINFRIFSENMTAQSMQTEVAGLIKELGNKISDMR